MALDRICPPGVEIVNNKQTDLKVLRRLRARDPRSEDPRFDTLLVDWSTVQEIRAQRDDLRLRKLLTAHPELLDVDAVDRVRLFE